MTTSRIATGAAVAATSTLLAVGCGGRSAAPSGVAGAVRETKNAKTARYSLVYTVPGTPATHGTGAVDFANYRGTSTLRTPGYPPYVSIWDISGVYARSSGISLFERTKQGPRKIRGTTRPWVFAATGEDFQFIGALKLLDLPRIVDLLATGSFRDVGRAVVSGQSVEHYQGSITFDRFVKVFLPASLGKPLLAAEHPPVAAEAWVGTGSLIRRVAYVVPALKSDSPAARARFDLHDLGKPVEISPPPAQEVMDARYLFDTDNGK